MENLRVCFLLSSYTISSITPIMTHVPARRVMGLQPSESLPCTDGTWMQTCVDISIVLENVSEPRIVDANHLQYNGRVHTLAYPIRPSESTFTCMDQCVTFELEKAHPNKVWNRVWMEEAPLPESTVDIEKSRLLRERFQREHLEFDFSSAVISGSNIPDPFTFLDDVYEDEE